MIQNKTPRCGLLLRSAVLLWSLAFLSLLCAPVGAQSLTRRIDDYSTVDWERFVVRSSSRSTELSAENTPAERSEALENAKLGAVHNLLTAVESLPFDGRNYLKSAFKGDLVRSARIKAAVQRYTIVDTRSMSDMSFELDIELSLLEHIADVIYPERMGTSALNLTDEALCPVCNQDWPEGKPVPQNVRLIVPSEGFTRDDGSPYTGLIIDARGLDLSPALRPRVITETGDEVYGVGYAERERALEDGLASYRSTLQAALADSRSGEAPLIVRAMGTSGDLNTEIVLSTTDALLVHAAATAQNFLKRCRVVIVVS